MAVAYEISGGYMEVKQIGNMDNNRENFENPQCGRVYDSDGLSPTLNTCQGGQREPKIIVAMRGRNPDNPSDRTAGIQTEQRLEPNSQGICNTLTSVQKDNLVLENPITTQGNEYAATIRGCMSKCGLANIKRNCEMGRGYGYEGIIEPSFHIRKLTPLECWRLMGFSDEDFGKAKSVNSNSQLYKQAGNSIVENVLIAILGQMVLGKENLYKEI